MCPPRKSSTFKFIYLDIYIERNSSTLSAYPPSRCQPRSCGVSPAASNARGLPQDGETQSQALPAAWGHAEVKVLPHTAQDQAASSLLPACPAARSSCCAWRDLPYLLCCRPLSPTNRVVLPKPSTPASTAGDTPCRPLQLRLVG